MMRTTIICGLLLCVSCINSRVMIHRDIVPADRPEIEITDTHTGIIRSVDIDTTIHHIEPDDYKALRDIDLFNLQDTYPSVTPPFELFYITVRNTSTQPIRNISFTIKGGTTEIPALTLKEIHRRLGTKIYTIEEAQTMFTPRRLTGKETELGKIDFEKETIGYPFDFILPFDTGIFFAAFPMPPVELRRFKVSVNYTVSDIKKNVDFEMVRHEYRQDDPSKNSREKQ